MMNQQPLSYLIADNTQIAAIISENHFLSDIEPLSGSVKHLIYPTIKPERCCTYFTSERQVVKPIFECGETTEFSV